VHADGLADVGPHRQQHALPLVVAGAVGVRLAEVARRNGTVDGRDDLVQGDLLGRPRQHVAAADAALGAHQTGALERQEDLLEIGLREPSPHGDVAYRGGHLRAVQGE